MKFDANGWLDEAIEIDYSSKSMDRQGHNITHICLHGTAGGSSAQSIGEYFASGNVDASAHFVIGQDGVIVQGVPLSLAAWGNGVLSNGHAPYLPENINPNFYTVSIEHVKPSTDNSDLLTPIQIQKSFELNQCICDTYGVHKRAGDASGGIISHADIDPVNRSRCPGTYPWQQLWSFLANGTQPLQEDPMIQIGSGIGSYFTDLGADRWHCHNTNVDLIGGNLGFWRSNGGLGGLPLTNEIYLAQHPGTAIVVCERWIQVYDPKKIIDNPPGSGDVYLLHLDSGVGQSMIAKPQLDIITHLQTQITSLQGDVTREAQPALQAQIDKLTGKIVQIFAICQAD